MNKRCEVTVYEPFSEDPGLIDLLKKLGCAVGKSHWSVEPIPRLEEEGLVACVVRIEHAVGIVPKQHAQRLAEILADPEIVEFPVAMGLGYRAGIQRFIEHRFPAPEKPFPTPAQARRPFLWVVK